MVVLIYDPLLWNTSNFLVVQPYMKSHVNKTQDVQYSLILHFRQNIPVLKEEREATLFVLWSLACLTNFESLFHVAVFGARKQRPETVWVRRLYGFAHTGIEADKNYKVVKSTSL